MGVMRHSGSVNPGASLDVGPHAGYPGGYSDLLGGVGVQLLTPLRQDNDISIPDRGTSRGSQLGSKGVGDDEGEDNEGRSQSDSNKSRRSTTNIKQ